MRYPQTSQASRYSDRRRTGKACAAIVAAALAGFVASAPALAQSAPQGVDPELAQSTRAIAGELLTQLGGKLKAAIQADGPVAAVGVCKEAAPAIAHELSAKNGASVARVGTRMRNQKMGVPNDWQAGALAGFEARLAQGEKAADMEYWAVAEAGGKRELRFAKAIVVQEACLTCHGNKEKMTAPLLEKIGLEYPHDQATGYSVGQLRGAVVVSRPLASR